MNILVWAGRAFSTVTVIPFLMSAAMKLTKHPEIFKGMEHLGIPASLIMTLGIIELLCVIIYAIPQTAMLGSILLTGYIGGTIVTHLRMGEGVLLQVTLGVLAWLGLYLRDKRVRELLPVRKLRF